MNIHFDTDGKFPESYSEGDKLLGIVEFWMQFMPEVRESIIAQHEQNGDMFSPFDGIVQSVLKALQQVDMEKLKKEMQAAKRADDIGNSIKESRIRFGKDEDPNAPPDEPQPGDRVIFPTKDGTAMGTLNWKGDVLSRVRLDTPREGKTLAVVANKDIRKVQP